MRRALADYNVPFHSIDTVSFVIGTGREAPLWKMIDLPSSQISATSDLLQLDTIHLSFPVRYQLEVCLSNGFINEHNITRAFMDRLEREQPIRAQGILEKVAETGMRYWNPMDVFKLRPNKLSKKLKYSGHYTYMRSAQVTPSTIYYTTPVLETSNRVIRQYSSHDDRFLRVKFVEEKGKIYAKGNQTQEAIFRRIAQTLKRGIRIGDRLYEFLAFGNSQFRERGAYFFASDSEVNVERIRRWMGNFEEIRVVAKWASRLGQRFSTTRSILGVQTLNVTAEEDIERNGFTFTDGVGRMSIFIAQMIAHEFGILAFREEYPSVFQFRMGGCKGVLAVDPSLKPGEIVIRRSQHKFAAPHSGLDVCRHSAFATSQLNQQLITVLSALKVPDQVFLDMLDDELERLEEAMKKDNVAKELLMKRVDFNQMTLTLAAMIDAGFMKVKDPFMVGVLSAWRNWNVKYLKEKARLTVDQGAFVLGCVDETASLRGWYKDKIPSSQSSREEKLTMLPEIFLQVRDRIFGQDEDGPPDTHLGPYKARTGTCILARNPSLHPGDVRVVRAVDVEALHHLKDVVVLPQTGDRDLANMCSGGDLDGDDYVVIWDPNLIPPETEWFQGAMDFKAPKGEELNRAVTVDDATDFFIKYIKSDRLPVIAHAHLAQADISPAGVFDWNCIELAKLHSCAVDYPKSGVEVVIKKGLIPKRYPHFMNKPKHKTYHSEKVLGQMYDRVNLSDIRSDCTAAFDKRILNAYDFEELEMKAMLATAKEIKRDYDNAVRRIQAKHEIGSEFEVWSTFVSSHSRDMGDYKFHEEAGQLACALKDRFRKICEEHAGGKEFDKLGPFIAAMYKVTADEFVAAMARKLDVPVVAGEPMPTGRMNAKSMPLISFPWIFQPELGKIASGGMSAAGHLTSSGDNRTDKNRIRTTKRPSVRKDTVMDIKTKEGVVHAGEALRLFDEVGEADTVENQSSAVTDNDHEAMISQGIRRDEYEPRKGEAVILPSEEWPMWASEDKVLDLSRFEEPKIALTVSSTDPRVEDGDGENEEVEIEMDGPLLVAERLNLLMMEDQGEC